MSKRYMEQATFDAAALTVAMAKALGQDGHAAAEQIAASYSNIYSDKNLVADWDVASEKLLATLPPLFSKPPTGRELASVCKTISRAMMKFHPDGKPQRKGWFRGGALFNYEKSELPNKVGTCVINVFLYHQLLIAGAIDVRKLATD